MSKHGLTKKQRERKARREAKVEQAKPEFDYDVICDTCQRRQPMHKGPCWNCGALVGRYAEQ